MGDGSAEQLIGRDREIEYLGSFVDRAAREGDALLLAGEAGVGKSALLEVAAGHAAANGALVLRASGVEFEAHVSFAGLNQLLYPLFDDIDGLRPAHADALRVSLGLVDGSRSDQLVASNAALDLLTGAAGDRPVLVVVDDLPWIDPASSAVIAFIARRVAGTSVGFLAALRNDSETFFERAGLPEYQLGPLDDASSAALLDARFPVLAARVRQRLLAEAEGNPLALLELPASLIGPGRGAAAPLPEVIPLSHRLQSVFAGRVANLPPATGQLLLIAALDGTGDLLFLERATSTIQMSLADLAPAERAQLVAVDHATSSLTFRHSLIRSAVVEAATIEQRRETHELLAVHRADEPARRAWHLAETATAPDETIAALLQEVAHVNLRRGDSVTAIIELLRAADLSPAGTDRSTRLAEAAYFGASVAGEVRNVPELLNAARRTDPQGGGSLAGAVAGAYHLLNAHGDVDAAHSLLRGAIDILPDEAFDKNNQQLIEALYNLLLVCFFGGRADLWIPFRAAMERLRPRPPEFLALLGQTFSDPARTAHAALDQLDTAIRQLHSETSPARIVRVGIAAAWLDRLPQCRGALWGAVDHGREGGAITSAIEALFLLGNAAYWTGAWEELAAVINEGLTLCATHGYRLLAWPGRFLEALLAAARGDDATTRDVTNEMMAWAGPRGVRAVLAYSWHALALGALGRSDFEEAYRQATQISPAGTLASHVPHALWVILELVEAAVHSGRKKEAAAHVAAAYDAGLDGLSPRLELTVHGAAAMATPGPEQTELFDKALAVAGAERWPFDLARIQLSYGELLRRNKAISESREHLVAARETFERLDARPWAQRAAKEIRATGITIGRSDVAGPGSLSPQQLEIAQLAASGLTNKEIGERLFLSHRTVGTHLYQIFPKLGISSRASLRDALGDYSET